MKFERLFLFQLTTQSDERTPTQRTVTSNIADLSMDNAEPGLIVLSLLTGELGEASGSELAGVFIAGVSGEGLLGEGGVS